MGTWADGTWADGAMVRTQEQVGVKAPTLTGGQQVDPREEEVPHLGQQVGEPGGEAARVGGPLQQHTHRCTCLKHQISSWSLAPSLPAPSP